MRALSTVGVGTFALALAIGAAACGEKQEPDLSQLPPPPQPQAPTPQQGLPQAVVGSWQGTLRQRGTTPFSVRASIVSATDRKRNVVRYGGEIDCSGTWSYIGVDGPRVRFRELIDSGRGGNCKGEGTVTVRALAGEPERLAYGFRGGGIESSGVLRKP